MKSNRSTRALTVPAARPKTPTGITGLDEVTEGGLPNQAILRAELRLSGEGIDLSGVCVGPGLVLTGADKAAT